MSTLVGQKGQITIEAPIREKLGISAGWRAIQRIENDRVVIQFVPPKHNRSLAGVLYHAANGIVLTDEELEDAIERAWGEAVIEKNAICLSEQDRDDS